MSKPFWDFQYLGRCQYESDCLDQFGQFADCSEPAMAKVWWTDEGGKDCGTMLVCQEHFELIKKQEEES